MKAIYRNHCMLAVALFAPIASPQQTNTVTGIATYRERIALPPNAIFEATLEEVARADAPSDVIGRTRMEKPGQPPFQFSIQYDPARIVQTRSYSVRARITLDSNLMFTTDQAYPVLTQGKGSHIALIVMRRAGASPSRRTSNVLGALPASFTGDLPCADCPAIRYLLNLFPDSSFFLRMTYVGRNEVKPLDDVGRWELSADGSTLTLNGGKESAERFAVKSSTILRKLDLQGREIESKFNYDLRRTSAMERIEPRLTMRGMFRYMADAAMITECQTGQRWPVVIEGDYKALEAAYLKTKRQPAEELLVNLEGQVTMRPNTDTRQATPTLVVERYIGIWPGETCGSPSATSPLQETYWKLTRLGDKPVVLAEKQREPSVVFRSEQNRVTGFGGCNSFTGGYKLDGSELALTGVAATRMACMQGMDIEGALFQAFEKVRTYKILGQHLELYDASSNMLARFEARALK